jgi:hypothetical protein
MRIGFAYRRGLSTVLIFFQGVRTPLVSAQVDSSIRVRYLAASMHRNTVKWGRVSS